MGIKKEELFSSSDLLDYANWNKSQFAVEIPLPKPLLFIFNI